MDTRFSYCAVAALALLDRLDVLDTERAILFVESCRNFDGGYGAIPGGESHAGQGKNRGWMMRGCSLLLCGHLLHPEPVDPVRDPPYRVAIMATAAMWWFERSP